MSFGCCWCASSMITLNLFAKILEPWLVMTRISIKWAVLAPFPWWFSGVEDEEKKSKTWLTAWTTWGWFDFQWLIQLDSWRTLMQIKLLRWQRERNANKLLLNIFITRGNLVIHQLWPHPLTVTGTITLSSSMGISLWLSGWRLTSRLLPQTFIRKINDIKEKSSRGPVKVCLHDARRNKQKNKTKLVAPTLNWVTM